MINEAVDKVRRNERKEVLELKNTRYIWLKNQKNHTKVQKEKLDNLMKHNFKTSRAYNIKLALQDIYNNAIDKNEAMQEMQKWYNWAVRSWLEPIIEVSKTIKKNWQGIVNYFESYLTNGVLKG
jgi:transposase